MPAVFASLIVGFLASLLIVRLNRSGTGAGIDDASSHRRKLHGDPVPRTGGLAILAALLCGLAAMPREAAGEILVLLGCALPCVAGGLADDLSEGAPPRVRLALMAVSALLAWWLSGVRITRADLAPLDALLAEPAVGAAVTVLALLTVTNGINLVDGLNGLAGATCLMVFGALALAGAAEGDTTVASAGLLACGAISGFMAWNFPRGRIFLGDGGAYLLGFMAAALAILLVSRNPAVSPWFVPVLLAYPLTEVGFSVWRRRNRRRRGIVTADGAHLHHLVYRRVIRIDGPERRERRNALASLVLWGPCLLAVAPAVALRDNGPALGALLLLFVAGYVALYLRITRLRVPRWLRRPPRERPAVTDAIAIGDVQGCFDCLQALVARIEAAESADHRGAPARIWLCGDLVNRGPASLETLRWAMANEDRLVTVLGNHDLHLLAVAAGIRPEHRSDTLGTILGAPDRDRLIDWLRRRPLAHLEDDVLLVHAGLLPQWSARRAVELAAEVQAVLSGPDWVDFLRVMYGNQPDCWDDRLAGGDRLRVIVNALTRLRFCTPDGRMEFATKEGAGGAPAGHLPWFEVPGRASADTTVVFGHWSTLGFVDRPNLLGLDTGCVWGGRLTAVRLADRKVFALDCPQSCVPGDRNRSASEHGDEGEPDRQPDAGHKACFRSEDPEQGGVDDR